MWYEVKAIFESEKTYRYEVKGMFEVLKKIDRLKATSNVYTCDDKLVDVKVSKVD